MGRSAAEGKPLRVAFFGHGEGRRGDGLSTYSRELVRVLRAHGMVVRFVSDGADGAILPVERADAVSVSARHWKTVVIPHRGTLHTIRRVLADFRPDVVHISWSFSLQDGAIAREAHLAGAACVATFHLPHGPSGTARGRVLFGLYRYHRRKMRHVDRCIALSAEQRDLLVRAGYPPGQVVVIPNGVDTDVVTPGASTLHEEMGARLVVVYVGRLDPEKRVPALVESFLALGLPHDVVLCIAGDGIQRDRLRRVAQAHDNVRLLGLVSSARALELLRGCDVFVLPSTAEGLALSLLEAMAAGCAIVATDAGDDGRALHGAGVVIPTHPLRPALDSGLRRLLDDAALRDELGRAARARAVERYSMRANATEVLDVYRAAAGQRAAKADTASVAAVP